MAHKIFTYDSSKTTGGRNTNKATSMIRQTELNLLENKKQAPFTGYSNILKESFVSTKFTNENSINESFNIGKFVSHQDLEQRDKALTKFIQENVSKQISHSIEKFKMTGLKEFLDKSLESQKEEFDTIKKLTKKNEESLSQLQTEKVNYEQTLQKIELVLERQFASATAAGNFVSFKENQPSHEDLSKIKEDIKAIQLNMKNLKEAILTQINEQLTQGLSTVSLEQDKMKDLMQKMTNLDHFHKMEDNLRGFEKKFEVLTGFITEQKLQNEQHLSKYEEILKIIKYEHKDIQANLADSDRFKLIEEKIDNCLSDIHKNKDKFEESLSKKLDSFTFDHYRLEKQEKEQKPRLDGVFMVKPDSNLAISQIIEETNNDRYKNNTKTIEKDNRFTNENIEESLQNNKIIVQTTPLKESPKENYKEWLQENKEIINEELQGRSPEKLKAVKEIRNILEGGDEASVISEIKPKEEEFNSEIRRDFESINKAMGSEEKQKVNENENDNESPDKKNMFKNYGSGGSVENDEDAEIIYNIDEQGFLIDEGGNYILDDDGKMVKLSPEHIEYLRESNMYEEEFTSKE